MAKGKSSILIIVAIAAVVLWGVKLYNNMVTAEEAVKGQWGNVENAYQRRADLIPSLVSTVQGAANYERGTLEAVINARAEATQTKIDASDLSEENIAKFQKAQDALSASLGRLMAVHEAYPELKANENFLALQAQIEGTENRINVERNKFNEDVEAFNTMTRKFPANLIASIGGFKAKGYFKAAEGSENAPKVEFAF